MAKKKVEIDRDWDDEHLVDHDCLICFNEFKGNNTRRICWDCWDKREKPPTSVLCRAIGDYDPIWREGFYVPMIGIHKTIHFIYTGFVDSGKPQSLERHRIKPETLCKHIGWSDSDGESIWTGSIVDDVAGNFTGAIVVEGELGKFRIEPGYEPRDLFELLERDRLIITGSIHDDLLKEKL